MIEIISLIVIFWLPPFLVIFKNFLWNLHFWQIREYKLDRFWLTIRWDLENTNKNHFAIILKFILFSLIILVFQIPEISLIACLVLFILWWNESIIFFQDFYNKKISLPSLKSGRNFIIIALFLLVLSFLILGISLPFISLDRVPTYEYFNSINSISKTVSTNFVLLPDIVILLTFSTLLAIMLDLASSLVVILFVFLTSPFGFIKRKLTIYRAKQKIQKIRKDITVVAIVGSYGKSTTKKILEYTLKDSFNTVTNSDFDVFDSGIARTILKKVKTDTNLLILEMSGFSYKDIEKSCEIITPDITIVTDIHEDNIGLFKTKSDILKTKISLLKHLNDNSTLIINGDSESYVRMSEYFPKTTYVFTKSESKYKALIENSKIKPIVYSINKHNKENILNLDIQADFLNKKLKVNHYKNDLDLSLVSAIILTDHLGKLNTKTEELIQSFNINFNTFEILNGDNNYKIVNNTSNKTITGFLKSVDYINTLNNVNHRFALINGFKNLGKHKKESYSLLAKQLNNKLDYVITTDYLLSKIIHDECKNIKVLYSKDFDDSLYACRTLLEADDIIIVEGRDNITTLEELVSK